MSTTPLIPHLPTASYLLLQSPTWHQTRCEQQPPAGRPGPRGRLPPGRVDVRRSGEEVRAAPAQVQAFCTAGPTSRFHGGAVGMRGRHLGEALAHCSSCQMQAACSLPHRVFSSSLQSNASVLYSECCMASTPFLHSLHNFTVHIVLLHRGTLWH